MKRLDIEFYSEGDRCAAWLYLPETSKPAPVLIMAHGLGGIRTMRLDAFAERFCNAGYACIVFDYRHFGDSDGEPRQLLSVKKQLQDWANAIAYAQQESRVDAEKIIVWGTSFSGGHALKTVAKVSGVAGLIAQCPFTDGLSSSLALNPISSFKVSLYGLADLLLSGLRKEPVQVPLVAKSGQLGLMTAHDVLDGYHALKPDATQNGAGVDAKQDYVSARFAYDIIRYFPGRYAKKIACPSLIVVCLQDTVAPSKRTLKHVRKIAGAQVVELNTGHFDIYVGSWFEKNVALQLDWLKSKFPVVCLGDK